MMHKSHQSGKDQPVDEQLQKLIMLNQSAPDLSRLQKNSLVSPQVKR
ncbi:hypothetical protein [Legionella antarctica]|nr:hypothetical protein [Legionella antarctica]